MVTHSKVNSSGHFDSPGVCSDVLSTDVEVNCACRGEMFRTP